MRTRTAGENTILSAAQKGVTSAKIEVKDAAGVYQDWFSRLLSVIWGASIDQPIVEVRLNLKRDNGLAASLSPFRGDSTLNIGGAAIDAGRDIRISPATTAWGVAPLAGDYKLLFQGKTADIDFANAAMDVLARDLGGVLVKKQIKAAQELTFDPAVSFESVLQDLLDDWAPGVTLYVPVSPGKMITSVNWAKGSLFDALRTAAGSIGWDIRYLWDNGTSSFRLTLFEPDRTKTVPDWTFAKDRYIKITQLAINPEFVRNYIQVSFFNSATGVRETVFATDPVSVARFDEQWMEIEEADDSPINTTAEAQALADAARDDLAWPIADKQVEMPFFWPVELNDLIRFTANDVHADDDIDLAVTGFEHRLDRKSVRTIISVRGKPAGFYKTWLKRAKPGPPTPVEGIVRLRGVVDAAAGTVDLFVSVIGSSTIFPASVVIKKDDPVIGSTIASFTALNSTEIGPAQQAALNNLVLPIHQADNYYAVVTTALGAPLIGYTSVDRNKDPGGSVQATVGSYPILHCRYDDDVEQIVIITPTANKTYSGLSGGGSLTYKVSDLLDGGVLREPPLAVGEVRSGYRVEYRGGGTTFIPFDGSLHGPPALGEGAGQGRASVFGTFKLDRVTNALSMEVLRTNLDYTLGFIWAHSTVAYPTDPTTGTKVFYAAIDTKATVTFQALAPAATAYVTLWAFGFPPKDAAPATAGTISGPVNFQIVNTGTGPYIVYEFVTTERAEGDLGMPGPSSGMYIARFSINISDSSNRGGTFEAWTQSDSGLVGGSPNLAGPPDISIVVGATPYTRTYLDDALLTVAVTEVAPVLVKFKYTTNPGAAVAEALVNIPPTVGTHTGTGGLNPQLRIDDSGTGIRPGVETGGAGAGTPGWSTGWITVGGVKDMSRQYPGNLLPPFAYRARIYETFDVRKKVWNDEGTSFDYVASAELAPGEKCSVSALVMAGHADAIIVLALGFYDDSDNQIGTLNISEPVSGTVLQRRYIRNLTVPSNCYYIAIVAYDKKNADGGGASPGAKWLEDPVLVRGEVDPLPNTAQSAVTRQHMLDEQAGLLNNTVMESEAREKNSGVPGERYSGAPVTDSAGLLTLLDTVNNRLQNSSLSSNVTEAGGRAVNRLLAKSLAADPDNIDSVLDGTLFGKTLVTALTSGQVDIAKAGVISKYLTNLARTSGDATLASTIVQYLANTGHASASMQESAGRAINRLLAKVLTADPDTLDAVVDGTSYGKALLSALTSGQVDLSKSGVIAKYLTNLVRSSGDATLASALVQKLASSGDLSGIVEVIGGDLYVNTGSRVRFGGIGSPQTITKTLRISAAELIPKSSGYSWQFTGAYFAPAGATTDLNAFIALLLANGCTITAMRARTFKLNAGDTVTADLIRADDSGAATSFGTATLSATNAWTTISITGLSEVVNNTYAYYIDCRLAGTSTNVRFAWFEVDYTTPNYAIA